jgi:hypothetical protein
LPIKKGFLGQMKNQTMNKVSRRITILVLTAWSLLVMAFPAAAQEDPLANAVLLPGVVGWIMLILAIILILALRFWWMRGR